MWGALAMPVDLLARDAFLPWHKLHRAARVPGPASAKPWITLGHAQ